MRLNTCKVYFNGRSTKKTTTITSQDCVFRQCLLASCWKTGLLAYCLLEAKKSSYLFSNVADTLIFKSSCNIKRCCGCISSVLQHYSGLFNLWTILLQKIQDLPKKPLLESNSWKTTDGCVSPQCCLHIHSPTLSLESHTGRGGEDRPVHSDRG